MKNTISCLLLIAGLLSACSKKKDAGPGHTPEEKMVSRLMHDADTLQVIYHPDGTVRQFKQYGQNQGFTPDSTQVLHENGNMIRFRIWAMGELRDDRSFQYNGERQLVKINYYNMVSPTELAVTDKDSIVYKQGKPAELHVINGTIRNEVYKLAWEKENVSEVAHFLVIGGEEVLYRSTKFTYNDKAALHRSFPTYLLFLLSNTSRDFTALSANTPLKAQTAEHPGPTPVEQVTYEYTYNDKGELEKIKTKTEALPGGQTDIVNTGIAYTQPQ